MSWSRSATGHRTAILGAIACWAASVRQADTAVGSDGLVADTHEAQATTAARAIEHFADTTPEGHNISVSVGGHANPDGSGSVYVSYSHAAPVSATSTLTTDAPPSSDAALGTDAPLADPEE